MNTHNASPVPEEPEDEPDGQVIRADLTHAALKFEAHDAAMDAANALAVQSGNHAAFSQILERHSHAVRSFIGVYTSLGNADIDDLAQEVFVTAYQDLTKWSPERSSLRTWLLGIARFRCLSQLRKRRTHQKHGDSLRQFIHQQDLNRLSAGTDGFDEIALEALQLCTDSLPKNQQDMIRIRYRDNAPIESIADQTNKTPEAVRVSLSRIRRALKKCIEKRMRQGST